ncbi:MAG: hypothetical protein QOJ34_1827 [Pseudonocardiales bacterium]|jgi:hypothetical protein|nr:hypothetical protein [Pseudonocardiales bacterium]
MPVDVLAKSGEAVKSGPIGLAVILILCIGCYFLFKSMSKHMRKVREEFPGEDGQQPDAGMPPADPVPAPSVEAPSTQSTAGPADSVRPTAERPAE